MTRRATPFVALLLALTTASACGGRSDTPHAAEPAVAPTVTPPVPPAVPEGPSGTVIGIVRLAEGAELPSWPLQVMPHPFGTQVPRPEVCGPPKLTDTQSAQLDAATRGLSNVLLAPSDFDHAPPITAVTHEVVIRDCRLEPAFLVGTMGDRVHITNLTNYPFLPSAGEAPGITQALMKDQAREFTLERMGPRTIGCSAFGAACGRTDVMTMAHPLHAVTGADGRYRIERVPANEPLRLHAWNPLFHELVVPLRLEPGETKTIDLILTPDPVQLPPEPPPGPPRDPREGDIH